jgi:hypothetical protein
VSGERPGGAELEEELRAIRAELAELRAEIAPDLAARRALLQAIRSVFGDALFCAVELVDAGSRQHVLAKALAPVAGSPASKLRLSRRLTKFDGKPAGGLTLHRVGKVSAGALFVVKRTE